MYRGCGAKSLSVTLTCTCTFALDPQAPFVENGYANGTVEKGTASKMAFVTFTHSLIKSRGKSKLAKRLQSTQEVAWVREGWVTLTESQEQFRRPWNQGLALKGMWESWTWP